MLRLVTCLSCLVGLSFSSPDFNFLRPHRSPSKQHVVSIEASGIVLLARNDVRRELSISENQQAHLQQWLQSVQDDLCGSRLESAFVQAAVTGANARLNNILTPVQQQRLRQLSLQCSLCNSSSSPGSTSLQDQVYQQLALTPSQRRRIDELPVEISDDCRALYTDILTADQRRLWSSVLGEPFSFEEPIDCQESVILQSLTLITSTSQDQRTQ